MLQENATFSLAKARKNILYLALAVTRTRYSIDINSQKEIILIKFRAKRCFANYSYRPTHHIAIQNKSIILTNLKAIYFAGRKNIIIATPTISPPRCAIKEPIRV